MSVFVLGEVKIGELDQFMDVFASDGQAKRSQHGCLGARVFRPADEQGRVLALLEWRDLASFDAFRADPDVPPTMRRGGAQGPPQFTVLESIAELPS